MDPVALAVVFGTSEQHVRLMVKALSMLMLIASCSHAADTCVFVVLQSYHHLRSDPCYVKLFRHSSNVLLLTKLKFMAAIKQECFQIFNWLFILYFGIGLPVNFVYDLSG